MKYEAIRNEAKYDVNRVMNMNLKYWRCHLRSYELRFFRDMMLQDRGKKRKEKKNEIKRKKGDRKLEFTDSMN